jgi:hypothetical protein
MATVSEILLLSGLPGAGKSEYSKHLERRGWLRLEHDAAIPAERAAIEAAISGNDEPLLTLVLGPSKGVVLEWGFHPDNLPQLKAMIGRGYNAWYFDGDRGAARAAWQRAWPETDVAVWDAQCDRLTEHKSEIAEIYGSHVVTTIRADGHVRHEVIDRLIGV